MSAAEHDVNASPRRVADHAETAPITCFALLGNPNTGKTTLFNRLCGIRSQTANFPGSTVEARIGAIAVNQQPAQLIDLPGIYGLNLDRPESKICTAYLAGEVAFGQRPQAIIVVADATNLQRNLIFVNQALQLGLPVVIALNMMDLAQRRGLTIDINLLSEQLGCPVAPVSARSGRGVDRLRQAMAEPSLPTAELADPANASAAAAWADRIYRSCASSDPDRFATTDRLTDRLDAVFTHPILGLVAFGAIITGLFFTIFSLAQIPMDLIDLLFGQLGALVTMLLPPGAVRDLLANGVVGGVAGTVVFLPQICLLFFLISLLEDTGYLARAAFVLDRVMRRFGLPGQAFIPLLTAHACAIPAIMSARLIPDRRDRIAAVLVAPFMSCSARLPVYVLLVGVLFPDNALYAAAAFTGCYVLGALAAFLTALLTRRTVLRGASPAMVIELPTYKLPSLRTALLTTLDRAWLFLRKVGTVILGICIVLWWLSAYPRPDQASHIQALRAASMAAHADAARAETLTLDADLLQAAASIDEADLSDAGRHMMRKHAVAGSFAGRLGHLVEPVFQPIGMDWQLTVGLITSFAAREVFVSTLAVLFAGSDEADDEAVLARISGATRDDGSPLLTIPTAASLLVFYVLAMQCLPTLAVTARESGHWGWALLQFTYMSSLAYALALLLHAGLLMMEMT